MVSIVIVGGIDYVICFDVGNVEMLIIDMDF